MTDRRLHDRIPVTFQVCVTVVAKPEISARGETQDISKSGIGVFLPFPFPAGSLVRLDIADSVLYGFVSYLQAAGIPPERRSFHTGIEIVDVVMGTSGMSQLLKTALEEALPNLVISSSGPARYA